MENKTTFIVLTIILILLLVAGGIFYYLDRQSLQQKYDQAKQELEQQIDDLKKELDDLKSTKTESSTCASTLTSADKTEIKTWKTYENTKYDYSFKYPETWEISSSKSDLVSLKDSEASINFQFRSDTMTALGYEGYKVDKKQTIKVACQSATKTSLLGDTSVDPSSEKARMLFVQFKKDGTDHLIMLSYTYEGASISSDIVEAFDLILKTITFK